MMKTKLSKQNIWIKIILFKYFAVLVAHFCHLHSCADFVNPVHLLTIPIRFLYIFICALKTSANAYSSICNLDLYLNICAHYISTLNINAFVESF